MRRFVTKKNGMLTVVVLVAMGAYFLRRKNVKKRVPPRFVGQGYASTPYGSPQGNPYTLRSLNKGSCCGSCARGGPCSGRS